MVETSFDKILNSIYKVHLDTILEALDTIGYDAKKDVGGLSAVKCINNYRLHFIITILPTGEIDRYCIINLHKDLGTGLFHTVIDNDDDIENEINLFSDILSKIIKRKRYNFKKRYRKLKTK